MDQNSCSDDKQTSLSVRQHMDWLEKDLEALLDAEFLAYAKMPVNREEIDRLRGQINELKAIINRYKLLGSS